MLEFVKFVNVRSTLEDRFWAKVDKKGENECWEWKGAISGGYGSFNYNGNGVHAHRVVYILVNGKISDEVEICHICDNPSCCNPNHLFSGTHKDNMVDRVNKERSYKPIGEKHPNTELTWEKVHTIRERYCNGEKIPVLAKEFKLTRQQMFRIVNNIQWKDDNYRPVYKHGNAKINWNIVHDIRNRYKKNEKQVDLAKEYSIDISTVNKIVSNETWKEQEET
jgi:Mor family transcriptional regulator